jgi:hypothetical protein
MKDERFYLIHIAQCISKIEHIPKQGNQRF